MELIPIDKNIPIPLTKSGRKTSKYPWKEMEVGDSFFVSSTAKRGLSAQANINGRKLDRQYITRSVDGGLRIWRTK